MVSALSVPHNYVAVPEGGGLSDVWDDFGRSDIQKISFTSGVEKPFQIQFEGCSSRPAATRYFTEGQLNALVGKQVARFARASGECFGKALCNSVARRIGLLDNPEDQRSYELGSPDDVDWIIGEIWLVPGRRGAVDGRYYACGVNETREYPIDLYTLQQWGSSTSAGYGGSWSNAGEGNSDGFWKADRSQMELVLEVDNWCIAHPGSKRRFHTAKSREPSLGAVNYFDESKPIVCRDRTDECTRASFANALALIDGGQEARRYWDSQPVEDKLQLKERGYRSAITSIRHMTRHVEAAVPGVTLRHVYSGGVRLDQPHSRFFVDRVKRGIYVVTLQGVGDLLHSICIDTRQDPGYIYDSSEPYAMRLCKQSLFLCVGDHVSYEGMKDLREVVRFAPKVKMDKKRKRTPRSERRGRRREGGFPR